MVNKLIKDELEDLDTAEIKDFCVSRSRGEQW